MNKITRSLTIAGLAGASMLGGLTLTAASSSAQVDDPSAQESPATPDDSTSPAADETPDQTPDGTTEGCERGEGRGHRGPNLEVAADAIGIDAEALHSALDSGMTLAEVAQDNGVDPQAVIDALVSDVSDHLAEKVADGTLTQDEADQRLADATERITDHVLNGRPERPEGEAGPRGPRGPADDTEAPTADA